MIKKLFLSICLMCFVFGCENNADMLEKSIHDVNAQQHTLDSIKNNIAVYQSKIKDLQTKDSVINAERVKISEVNVVAKKAIKFFDEYDRLVDNAIKSGVWNKRINRIWDSANYYRDKANYLNGKISK